MEARAAATAATMPVSGLEPVHVHGVKCKGKALVQGWEFSMHACMLPQDAPKDEAHLLHPTPTQPSLPPHTFFPQ